MAYSTQQSYQSPLQILRQGIDSYAPYLQPSGELHDPVFGEPTQYGTAYYALCNAALATKTGTPSLNDASRQCYAERSLRGLRAALEHVSNRSLVPTASSFRRDTGQVRRENHRDFFWLPILKTYCLLKNVAESNALAQQIASVDIEHAFDSRPPTNWAVVWLDGEWLRFREGLSPYSLDQIDRWLDSFFQQRILVEQGFYQEPGHPNSYDLFTRYHLANMLIEGYHGRWQSTLEQLLMLGLQRSLDVQLSDGSLASAHRSTGQTWTLGAQCAYFTQAANYLGNHHPALASQALRAAQRALNSMLRWQRRDGPYSPVENCLPPNYRVGYESYTADAHYGSLALSFLAEAVLHGLDQATPAETLSRSPCARIEHDPTHRAIAHNGNYSVHINACPSPDYDGFGIVDLTFGTDRFLHFASSARHVESRRMFNLGLAHRNQAGRSELAVMAQQDMVLLGEIERGDTPASLALQARPKGHPHLYRLAAWLEMDGVRIVEATPGLNNYKSLLVPYLRDAGTGQLTQVQISRGEIRLIHGEETVSIVTELPIEHILNLDYGFENRRGLCGLLRIDFRDPGEEIAYHLE
jgi:hypothetical protein